MTDRYLMEEYDRSFRPRNRRPSGKVLPARSVWSRLHRADADWPRSFRKPFSTSRTRAGSLSPPADDNKHSRKEIFAARHSLDAILRCNELMEPVACGLRPGFVRSPWKLIVR